MQHLLFSLREELTSLGNAADREGAQRFFKEPIESYGIRMAAVRAVAKRYAKDLKGQSRESVFLLCHDLFASGLMEEAHIAAFWIQARHKEFEREDDARFENWINSFVTNWSVCDNLCNNAVGAYLVKFPEQLPLLLSWAKTSNRWLRRAAAVSLIAPARQGLFLQESFDVATALLHDADDLVQKGYGWLLKEQCKKNEPAVFAFVMRHKASMPRTALRYAIEKMPAPLKTAALSIDK